MSAIAKLLELADKSGSIEAQTHCVLIPSERGKGYCTEAVQLTVDYLFMSKNIVRVQAGTFTENVASQKVLEKAGFQREGRMRKGMLA